MLYPSVVLIVGLPGSGKTHYVTESYKDEFKGYLFLDDPSVRLTDFSLFLEDPSVGEEHTHLVIADPMLCLESSRLHALDIFRHYDISWIFFANDPETCLSNLRYRNDGREISEDFIHYLSRNYHIPEDAEIISIHHCM